MASVPDGHQVDRRRYKKTYDLAGVAEALFASAVRGEFRWVGDSGEFPEANSLNKLYDARRMCCYEFVHFCAFLAGPQLTYAREGWPDIPEVNAGASNVYGANGLNSCPVWPAHVALHRIPRGAVVLGVSYFWNNANGYFHVGIADGSDNVISLSQETNMNRRPNLDVFTEAWYQDIRVADYRWRTMAQGYQPPPLPLTRF